MAKAWLPTWKPLQQDGTLIAQVKPCHPNYPPANVLKISNMYVMRGVIK